MKLLRLAALFCSLHGLAHPVPENPHWLPGAEFNIVESCFQAPAEATAIVFRGPNQPLSSWSYAHLHSRVREVAAAVRAAGFQEGDALAVVLPMTAESVAIYLGIIWAGCVVVSIADSFAPPEIANRIRSANARAVFTYDVQVRSGKTLPLYTRVAEATSHPIICLPNSADGALTVELREHDQSWSHFLARAGNREQWPSAHLATPIEPINILFSSGTTGDPKAMQKATALMLAARKLAPTSAIVAANLLNLEAAAAGLVLDATMLLSIEATRGVLPEILDAENIRWRTVEIA
jgi:acyl-coenzyme A synthetase/AMP-(fatty) acid ligase